jgi:hypothetical protein
MKWTHLPLAGGIYDQHPDLLDKFMYLFAKKSEQAEKERKKQEAEAKRGKTPLRHSSRGGY